VSEISRTGALGRIDARTDAARGWSRRRPTECLALALVLVVLGAGLLTLAVRRLGIGWGVLGALVVVAGLTALNDRLRIESDRHPLRWLILGVLITGAGAAVVAGAFAEDSAAAAALGSLVAVVGMLPVSSWLRVQAAKEGSWRWAPAGLVLMAGGVGWTLAGGPIWAAAAGPVLGLAAYKIGVRRACESHTGARVATWGGLGATAVGSGAILVASGEKTVYPGLVGVALLVLGLSAMSVGWPKLGRRPFTGYWAMAFGGSIVATGLLIAHGALNSTWPAAIVLALPVVAVGGSFVWRGEALVVAVLVATSFVWLTFDRTDPHPIDPGPAAAGRIVAFGDSYVSGEGAPRFLSGTNVRGEAANECRRAATAYPYAVAEMMGMGLDFFACSGAKAAQITVDRQAPGSPDGVAGKLPQIENQVTEKSKVRVVLVGIGGNDAGFSTIGKGCVLPGTCDTLRDVWMTNLDQIGTDVTIALQKIKDAFTGVPVVVVPYPLMLQDHSCGSSRLDDREHAFISEFVVVLNDRVRVAAETVGLNFFADEMFAFDGAKICDSEPTVMNFLTLNPVQGSFLERINPMNWIHGSLHPKPAGHARTAVALKSYLEHLLARTGGDPTRANPDPIAKAAFTYRNVRGTTPRLLGEADRPRDVPCLGPGEAVDRFGSIIRLLDEESPFTVPAAPDAPLCVASGDGAWTLTRPSPANPDARVADGVVYVPTGSTEARTDRVVFKGLDGRWQLRRVEYCSKTDCPDAGDFQNQQLGRTAQVVVPPVLVILLGGWLLAVGSTRRVTVFPGQRV